MCTGVIVGVVVFNLIQISVVCFLSFQQHLTGMLSCVCTKCGASLNLFLSIISISSQALLILVNIWLVLFLIYFIIIFLFVIHLTLGFHQKLLVRDKSPSVVPCVYCLSWVSLCSKLSTMRDESHFFLKSVMDYLNSKTIHTTKFLRSQ